MIIMIIIIIGVSQYMSVSSEQVESHLQLSSLRDIFQDVSQKKKYYQKHSPNKHQSELDQIHATSPSQTFPIDESNIFHQERKKCANCLCMQKKILQLDGQLTNERKKSMKYLKIVNTKIEKEKQLQVAYGQIAKQLKKRIELASNFEKNQLLSTISQRQSQEIHQIKERLRTIEQELKEKNLIIKQLTENGCKQTLIPPIQQTKSKRMSLNQNTNIKIQSTQSQKQSALKIFSYPVPIQLALHQPEGEAAKIDTDSFEDQTSEQKYRSIKRQEEPDSEVVQNYIFQRQNDSLRLSEYEARQTELKMEERESLVEENFKTVVECQSSGSFQSIHTNKSSSMFLQSLSAIDQTPAIPQKSHSQDKIKASYYSISEQNQSISQISGVSIHEQPILESNRLSDKQIIENFLSTNNQAVNEQNIITPINKCQLFPASRQIQQEKKINNQVELEKTKLRQTAIVIKSFVDKLVSKMNLYGQRYNICLHLPKYSLQTQPTSLEQSQKTNSKNQLEEILKSIIEHFEKIFKLQRKEYERILNDKQLQACDLQNKYYELNKQKQDMLNIIQSYQIQKSLMQIKLLSIEQKQQSALNSSKKSNRCIDLMQSIKRKIIQTKSQKMKNQQIECDIIPSDIMSVYSILQQRNFELIEALNFVPNFLNSLPEDNENNQNLSINFDKNLNGQLETILKSSFETLLAKSKDIQSQDFLKRVRSSNISINPSLRKDSESSQALCFLEAENQQLKISLKKKTEELLKCSQRNTLQNIEKAKCQKIIQNLNIELYSLKNERRTNEILHSDFKLQNIESTSVVSSPVKETVSQSGQFLEYEDKQEYNNLYWDRDLEVKELKEKIEVYEQQLKKCRNDHKRKKKIIYINH